MVTNTTVTIEVRGIELLALKKLSLVSHALASKIGDYRATQEQTCLATVLDEVIRRIELAAASAAPANPEEPPPGFTREWMVAQEIVVRWLTGSGDMYISHSGDHKVRPLIRAIETELRSRLDRAAASAQGAPADQAAPAEMARAAGEEQPS